MDLNTVISEPAGFLAGALMKGALLLAVAWLASFGLRRRASAAVHHAIWCLAFLGLLLLPLIAMILPGLPVPALSVSSRASLPAAQSSAPQHVSKLQTSRTAADRDKARVPSTAPAAKQASVQATPTLKENASPENLSAPELIERRAWPLVLLLVWSIGAAGLLVRLVAGLMSIARLNRSARSFVDPTWEVLRRQIEGELGLNRRTRLRWHHDIEMPMTFGTRNPVILLPAAATRWPQHKRRLVLLHELAHARRRDALTHQIMQVGRALHWPNPMVWIGSRRFVLEREKACDDCVLAAGANPAEYAEQLVEVARSLRISRQAFQAMPAMAHPSALKSRVQSILDAGRLHRTLSKQGTWAMAVFASAMVLPLAVLHPAAANLNAPRAASKPAASAGSLQRAQSLQQATDSLRSEAAGLKKRSASANSAANRQKLAAMRAAEQAARDATTTHQNTLDTQTEIQEQAVFALSRLPRKQSVPQLLGIAKSHANKAIRANAIFWLGQIGGPKVVTFLNHLIKSDAPPELQEKALFAISRLPRDQAVPQLMQMAKAHLTPELREKAIFWLGQQGGKQLAPFFAKLLNSSKNSDIQEKLVFAVSRLPNKQGVPLLIRLAKHHPNADVREKAIFWLGQSGDPRAANALMSIAQSK